MRRAAAIVIFVLSLSSLGACSGQGGAGAAGPPETVKEQGSYGLGARIGTGMRDQGVEIDVAQFVAGLEAALAGRDLALTDQELQTALTEFQRESMERMMAGASEEGDANAATGTAFLEENAGRDGVVELASGLQYEVITEGSGPMPGPTDRVTVHYTGTLIDGTIFDSSRERGTPATFQLNQVIPGWQEGLQLMQVGSRWKIYVPAELGYGMSPPDPSLGLNSTLIFDVQLLEIEG